MSVSLVYVFRRILHSVLSPVWWWWSLSAWSSSSQPLAQLSSGNTDLTAGMTSQWGHHSWQQSAYTYFPKIHISTVWCAENSQSEHNKRKNESDQKIWQNVFQSNYSDLVSVNSANSENVQLIGIPIRYWIKLYRNLNLGSVRFPKVRSTCGASFPSDDRISEKAWVIIYIKDYFPIVPVCCHIPKFTWRHNKLLAYNFNYYIHVTFLLPWPKNWDNRTHAVADPGFESRGGGGGGGGAWNSKTPKLVIATRSRRGPALAPSRGVRGHAPPGNFENWDAQICIFHCFGV